jgi:hypothetical protein
MGICTNVGVWNPTTTLPLISGISLTGHEHAIIRSPELEHIAELPDSAALRLPANRCNTRCQKARMSTQRCIARSGLSEGALQR